jgi:hypothetical protein
LQYSAFSTKIPLKKEKKVPGKKYLMETLKEKIDRVVQEHVDITPYNPYLPF